jgi:hypothetical protein
MKDSSQGFSSFSKQTTAFNLVYRLMGRKVVAVIVVHVDGVRLCL